MKIAEQEEREQRRMDIAATKEVCVYVAVCCDRHSISRGCHSHHAQCTCHLEVLCTYTSTLTLLMGVSSCTLCVGESVGAGYFSRSSLGAVCGGSHVCWYCVHPPLLTGRLRTRC